MITIYKPSNERPNRFFNHAGDSFRETIDEWESHGYVHVRESPDNYIWFGNVGETLLYDRPTTQWLESTVNYKLGLFGNPVAGLVRNGKHNVSWTFWGRRPKLLESFHTKYGKRTYDERTISSIFIGKIENEIQNKYRKTHDWGSVIEKFEMPHGRPGEYKYTQSEYLELLSTSKFGLSVRGFGPKCHREVELMGMGVVPLITPDVDIRSYHDPPVENVHYLHVDSPDDVQKVIKNTTKEDWERMSDACLKWYEKNVSVKGSFDTTCQIVEKYRMYKKPSSVCTICTNMCIHDLRVFMDSFRQHEPTMPIVVMCDDTVNKFIEQNRGGLQIQSIVCLNKYSNKNRKIMESESVWNEFMCLKSNIIECSLDFHKDTLFLDSDIVLMSSLPFVDTSKEIGLSRHDIIRKNEEMYGTYNAGYLYVNNTRFAKWWRTAIPTSTFYDQKCLDDVPNAFSSFEFDITDNFGWWRLLECDNPNERVRLFSLDTTQQCILYGGKPLRSIHTHLTNDNFVLTIKFNAFIKSMTNKLGSSYDYINKTSTQTKPIINVLCQYYNDKNAGRQNEIDFCFRYNLNNPFVERLITFNEPTTKLPTWLSNHQKTVVIPCKHRLTYKLAFEYASTHLKHKMVCVSNADIFITDNSPWDTMLKNDGFANGKLVYAQSRHDFDGTRLYKDPALQRMAYAHAQDAWFFVPPINVPDCDFELGTLGCDNAIADRFRKAGIQPINSPNTYKIGHYDICRGKTGSNYMTDKFREMNKGKTSPEKRGYYLVPDIDMVQSVDQLLKDMRASDEYKYEIICDIMSKHIKINN